MREILFRGKSVDNGEWLHGHYVHQYGADMIYLPDGVDREYGFDYYHVDKETVGQYTGLTDKNGNKIFEGDILEFSDRLVEVSWHAHLGCWDSNFLKFTNIENGRDDMSPCRWEYRAKVIGNIHDNPELLKGGE